MFKLLKLQVSRNQIQAIDIGLADDFRQRHPLIIIADRAIDGVVAGEIQLRLIAEQRGEGGLRVKIDRQNAVTANCQILRQMGRRCCFAAAAFEVGDGNHLAMFAALRIPVTNIAPSFGATWFMLARQIAAQRIDVVERVVPPTALIRFRGGAVSGKSQLAQVSIRNANQLGRFAGCK